MTPWHLILEWLWKVQVKVTRISKLISRKGAELGHMLPLTTNRKPYMASPMTSSHLTLSEPVRSKSRALRILSGRRAVCYTHICQYCITMVIYMPQKGLKQASGVFRCPGGLCCWNIAFSFSDVPLMLGRTILGVRDLAMLVLFGMLCFFFSFVWTFIILCIHFMRTSPMSAFYLLPRWWFCLSFSPVSQPYIVYSAGDVLTQS